nr:hypothetical protein [Massilia genomosp. 1]
MTHPYRHSSIPPSALRPALTLHRGAAAVLPTITVLDNAEPETASGPIRGYVARRSATATKTDTPIIETPQSVSVVGAQEIDTLKSTLRRGTRRLARAV